MQNSDSLEKLLKHAKEDTGKVKLLYQLSEVCAEQDMLKYLEPAEKLAVKLNYKKGIADVSGNLGYVYFSKGNIARSLEYYQKGLKMQEELGNKNGQALVLNNIAFAYKSQGDLVNTMTYFRKSLKLFEEVNNRAGIAAALNNIGLIYKSQSDGKALDYYQRSLKIFQELNDKSSMTSALNNIAGVYESENDIAKCLECHSKNLAIREEISDKHGMYYSCSNMGRIYADIKDLGKGEMYTKRALDIAKELGYPDDIKTSSGYLGQIYFLQGKYKEAYEMHVLFKQMADSVSNVETRKLAVKTQMQYEFDKKEAVTRMQQEKKEAITNEESRKQKVIIRSVCGILILMVIVALLVYRSYRAKQKANVEMHVQKEVIEEKQKEILDSIYYARKIQRALITSEKYIEKNLKRLNPD